MSMLKVDARGADQLVGSLRAAADELDDLAVVNDDVAQLLAVAGTAAAPQVTGTLAASVVGEGLPQGAVVKATAPYAVFVHARNPFLTRAVAAREPQVLDLYEGFVGRVLNQIRGA